MSSHMQMHRNAEALLLERMAISRAKLLALHAQRRAGQLRTPSLPARVHELVSTAPNVTLLAAVLVGALVIGPRTIVSVVVRNGLVGWIAKRVRRLAGV